MDDKKETIEGHKEVTIPPKTSKVGMKGGGVLKIMSLKPPEPVKVKPNKIRKTNPSQNVVTLSDIGRMWKKKNGVEIPPKVPKKQQRDSALDGERMQATRNNSNYACSDRKSTPRPTDSRTVLRLVDGEQGRRVLGTFNTLKIKSKFKITSASKRKSKLESTVNSKKIKLEISQSEGFGLDGAIEDEMNGPMGS